VGDIVSHYPPLYKARAGGPFFRPASVADSRSCGSCSVFSWELQVERRRWRLNFEVLFVSEVRRRIPQGITGFSKRALELTDELALEKLKNYRPTEKEPFMNERQRDYFRGKLLAWKDEILRESRITLQTLQEENVNHPDLADRASSETDRAIELRARDRQRKLISKIDAALQRIEDNTYGYCEETGEPISLKRLEARPIATLSVEAQERHEKREKVYRDE
jgi:DnaK suppressor protein